MIHFLKLNVIAPANESLTYPVMVNMDQIAAVTEYEDNTYVTLRDQKDGAKVVETAEAIENRLRLVTDVRIVEV